MSLRCRSWNSGCSMRAALSTAGALLKTRETNRASCSQLALRDFMVGNVPIIVGGLSVVKRFLPMVLASLPNWYMMCARPMTRLRRKVTIREIAEVANVSLSTVSRALRGDPRAKRRTAERVLQVARDLNYYP